MMICGRNDLCYSRHRLRFEVMSRPIALITDREIEIIDLASDDEDVNSMSDVQNSVQDIMFDDVLVAVVQILPDIDPSVLFPE